jgi:hypothetical protein
MTQSGGEDSPLTLTLSPEDGARGIAERAQQATLFFGDLRHLQFCAFNPTGLCG